MTVLRETRRGREREGGEEREREKEGEGESERERERIKHIQMNKETKDERETDLHQSDEAARLC